MGLGFGFGFGLGLALGLGFGLGIGLGLALSTFWSSGTSTISLGHVSQPMGAVRCEMATEAAPYDASRAYPTGVWLGLGVG